MVVVFNSAEPIFYPSYSLWVVDFSRSRRCRVAGESEHQHQELEGKILKAYSEFRLIQQVSDVGLFDLILLFH